MKCVRCIDFETTGTDAKNADVIEVGWCDVTPDGVVSAPYRILCRPQRDIEFEAMAVHHLTNEDVAGGVTPDEWKEALSAGDPVAFMAHSAKFEAAFWPEAKAPWICTYKSALRLWPDAPRHSAQVLRYWLRLSEVEEFDNSLAMPPHRVCTRRLCDSAYLLANAERRGNAPSQSAVPVVARTWIAAQDHVRQTRYVEVVGSPLRLSLVDFAADGHGRRCAFHCCYGSEAETKAMKIYRGIKQGSAAWFALRLGIPTASCFDQIITPTKRKLSASWKGYACRLISERLLNKPTETIEGQKWMDRGKELEPEAVQRFEVVNDIITTPVTFIKTDDESMGCSPDRCIFGTDPDRPLKVFEAKCPAPHTHLEYHLFGRGTDYECQIQGQMMIAEVDEAIFYSYLPDGPALTLKTPRDEDFIRDLRAALRQFNDNLHEYHELAKKLGDWQAFKEVVAPIDVEYGESAEEFPDMGHAGGVR